MADHVRVARLLRRLGDDVAVLEKEAVAPSERRADPMWLPGVKYSFITAVEAVIDVAQHLCAQAGWGPPKDNGHAVQLLADHGVLSHRLAVELRKASGFRNVLVHGYIDVDDEIVLTRMKSLGDLREFATSVANFLDEVRPPERPVGADETQVPCEDG